jgi:hypothetical protein
MLTSASIQYRLQSRVSSIKRLIQGFKAGLIPDAENPVEIVIKVNFLEKIRC